jgi:hypothetical protein
MSNVPTIKSAQRRISKGDFVRTAAEPRDLDDVPINIINERLDRAHATLDLIYTIAVSADSEELIESLCGHTLENALHSAMEQIREVKEAANSWGKEAPVDAGN